VLNKAIAYEGSAVRCTFNTPRDGSLAAAANLKAELARRLGDTDATHSRQLSELHGIKASWVAESGPYYLESGTQRLETPPFHRQWPWLLLSSRLAVYQAPSGWRGCFLHHSMKDDWPKSCDTQSWAESPFPKYRDHRNIAYSALTLRNRLASGS
jgi:hypothetical protein